MRLRQLLPEPYRALSDWHASVEKACADAGLAPLLLDLVRLRASQLNGCAFCVDMHSHEARERDERQSRLDVLPVWREAGEVFTAEERTALNLTEAMTLLPARGVPDDVYSRVSALFTADQVGALIMAISVINAYNRLGVAAGAHPPRRD